MEAQVNPEPKSFKSVIENYAVPCLCETYEFFPGLDLTQFEPKSLGKLLQQHQLSWRIGKRGSSDLQWESSCSSVSATISQVLEWNLIKDCQNPTTMQKDVQHSIGACCHKHYWLYADYKYMKDVFKDHPRVLQSLKWDSLGFKNKTGEHTTMWIGTRGAYTLCHYDTYGYNIVLQISGSKRWVFFPPSDTDLLYPTRIPYEESSVFSEVNLSNPDLVKHPRFSAASACSVVLRPGDVLYVPRHWWHYVENLELSTSVNLWCDVGSDAEDRLKESITRLLVGGFASNLDTSWANPNEDRDSVQSTKQSLEYLNQSFHEISCIANNKKVPETLSHPQVLLRNGGANPVIIKPLSVANFIESGITDLLLSSREHANIGTLSILGSNKVQNHEKLSLAEFVQHLTHPKVVTAIASVIQSRTPKRKCCEDTNGASEVDGLELVSVSSETSNSQNATSTERDILSTPLRVNSTTNTEQDDENEHQVLLPPPAIPIKLEPKTLSSSESVSDVVHRHSENPRFHSGLMPCNFTIRDDADSSLSGRDTNVSSQWVSEDSADSSFSREFLQPTMNGNTRSTIMHDHLYSTLSGHESSDTGTAAMEDDSNESTTISVAEIDAGQPAEKASSLQVKSVTTAAMEQDDSGSMIFHLSGVDDDDFTPTKRTTPAARLRKRKRDSLDGLLLFQGKQFFKGFPLNTVNELNTWEKKFQNDKTYNKLVNVILSVEERDITAYIDIVMQSLVTYELAEQCSLSGRNGKYAIGHTKLVQAVLEAGWTKFSLGSRDRKDFRKKISGWLVTNGKLTPLMKRESLMMTSEMSENASSEGPSTRSQQ